LFYQRRRADFTLDSIGDAVLSTDLSSRVTYLNPVAERMTGWSRQEALGRPLAEIFRIVDGETREGVQDPMGRAMHLNRIVGLTPNCLLIRRDGLETAIEDSASPIHDQGGHTLGAVIVFKDVNEARAMSAQTVHLAQHDFLTDLPNRVLLTDRLTQAIELAHRHGHRLAVLFLDLDRFKRVNDHMGHMAGDALLQFVARCLLTSVRNSDTVSRQGGDEFVVLLPEIEHSADAAVCARKIASALLAPRDIVGHKLNLTVTIGISIYPDDAPDAAALITCADAAMYHAKQLGRDRYQFFERAMHARSVGAAIDPEPDGPLPPAGAGSRSTASRRPIARPERRPAAGR
jgi:diguanylate cyclase (GGDEF)-like protein/PAS domain S-box-containing protein